MTETEAIVFIVDDDVPMRASLKKLIRSIGLRAELFASAQEFLQSTGRQFKLNGRGDRSQRPQQACGT